MNTCAKKGAITLLCLSVFRVLSELPAVPFGLLFNGLAQKYDLTHVLNAMSGNTLLRGGLIATAISALISGNMLAHLIGRAKKHVLKRDGLPHEQVMEQKLALGLALVIAAGLSMFWFFSTRIGFSSFLIAGSHMVGTLLTAVLAYIIDEYGLGNGLSLLIASNLIYIEFTSLRTLREYWDMFGARAGDVAISVIGSLLILVVAVLYSRSENRLPFVLAREGENTPYEIKEVLPIRMAIGGIMPIIIGRLGIAAMELIFQIWGTDEMKVSFTHWFAEGAFGYITWMLLFVFVITRLQVHLMVNPVRTESWLQNHGALLQDVKPGKETIYAVRRAGAKTAHIAVLFLLSALFVGSIARRIGALPVLSEVSAVVVTGALIEAREQYVFHRRLANAKLSI